MLFKTHLAFSLFWLVLIYEIMDISSRILFGLTFFFFAIFPDIDSAASTIGKAFRPASFLLRHRGFFHSIFPAIIIAYAFSLYQPELGFAVMFGYLSHIMLDALNHQGIAPLYPIIKFRIKGILRSGGLADRAIFFLSLIVTVIIDLAI